MTAAALKQLQTLCKKELTKHAETMNARLTEPGQKQRTKVLEPLTYTVDSLKAFVKEVRT